MKKNILFILVTIYGASTYSASRLKNESCYKQHPTINIILKVTTRLNLLSRQHQESIEKERQNIITKHFKHHNVIPTDIFGEPVSDPSISKNFTHQDTISTSVTYKGTTQLGTRTVINNAGQPDKLSIHPIFQSYSFNSNDGINCVKVYLHSIE